MTRLILTCGLPGAGKTTLAKQIAETRGAVRLTSDDWLWAVGSSPWDPITQGKMENQLCLLAQDLLRLRVSVVLDFGLWARSERDALRATARDIGVGAELHYLPVPPDELWRRIQERNQTPPWNARPILRTDLESWLPQFQVPNDAEMALFDPVPK